jgi:hypothetical protein
MGSLVIGTTILSEEGKRPEAFARVTLDGWNATIRGVVEVPSAFGTAGQPGEVCCCLVLRHRGMYSLLRSLHPSTEHS